MEVRVQARDIEKALRLLKKKLQVDGILGELKKRRFYEKPSVKKKRKRLEAQKRRRKLVKRSHASGTVQTGTRGGLASNRTSMPAEAGKK